MVHLEGKGSKDGNRVELDNKGDRLDDMAVKDSVG